MYYYTDGSVRGNCGHKHQTLKTAVQCLNQDQTNCKKSGSYSDRWVYAVVGGLVTHVDSMEVMSMEISLQEGK